MAESTGATFVNWYLNKEIPGHWPLEPLIWACETGDRIVAPLPEGAWNAVVEVLTRIALAALMLISAIVGTFLIPLGLLTKLIGGAIWPAPEVPIVKPSDPPPSPSMSASASTSSSSSANVSPRDSIALDASIIQVANNGNCLFEAFNVLMGKKSSGSFTIPESRKKAAEWISANYKTDAQLQIYWIQQLSEHFGEKCTSLSIDIKSHEAQLARLDSSLEASNKEQMKAQKEKWEAELKELEQKCETILLAQSDIEMLGPILTEYLSDIVRDGVFGGAAELYALSHAYKVCIRVYKITDPDKNITDRFNEEAAQADKDNVVLLAFDPHKKHYDADVGKGISRVE